MKAFVSIISFLVMSSAFAAPTESLEGWVRANPSCPTTGYEIYTVDENEKPDLVTCIKWSADISQKTKDDVIAAEGTGYTLFGEQSEEGFIVASVVKDENQ